MVRRMLADRLALLLMLRFAVVCRVSVVVLGAVGALGAGEEVDVKDTYEGFALI
jgi:hypothetical protein